MFRQHADYQSLLLLARAADSFSFSSSKHQGPDKGHRALSTERRRLGTTTRQRHPTPPPGTTTCHHHPTAAPGTTTGHQLRAPPPDTSNGHHHRAPLPGTTTRSPCSETFRIMPQCPAIVYNMRNICPPSEGAQFSASFVRLPKVGAAASLE